MKKLILLLSILPIISFSDTILTDNNITYTLTNMLTNKLDIKVKSLFETNTSLRTNQALYFEKKEYDLKNFNDIVAVVDIQNIWPQEMLYTYARRNDIRVVQIDASKTYTNNSSMVLTLINNNTYVWLDFNNAKKLLKNIANDLAMLYPNKKEIVYENLYKSLNDIKNIEDKYLEIDNIDGAIILDESLAYLLSYLNIPFVYVENKEDILKVSKETSYNIVFSSRNENRNLKKLLSDNNIKFAMLQNGSFPMADPNNDELMSKKALIDIYNYNLEQLKKLNGGN